MNEEQEREAGAALAKILKCRHDPFDVEKRWLTTWGTKTDLGLWRIVARIVDEAREGKEVQP